MFCLVFSVFFTGWRRSAALIRPLLQRFVDEGGAEIEGIEAGVWRFRARNLRGEQTLRCDWYQRGFAEFQSGSRFEDLAKPSTSVGPEPGVGPGIGDRPAVLFAVDHGMQRRDRGIVDHQIRVAGSADEDAGGVFEIEETNCGARGGTAGEEQRKSLARRDRRRVVAKEIGGDPERRFDLELDRPGIGIRFRLRWIGGPPSSLYRPRKAPTVLKNSWTPAELEPRPMVRGVRLSPREACIIGRGWVVVLFGRQGRVFGFSLAMLRAPVAF